MMAKRICALHIGRVIKMKSKLEDIEAHTKCLACGRHGHWFCDNEASMNAMRQKMDATEKTYGRKDAATDDGADNLKEATVSR